MYIEYEFIAATFPYYTNKDAYVCTLNYCCQDVKFDFFIAATFLYYTMDTYASTLNYCCQDVKFDFFFFLIRTDHELMDRSALLGECKPCTVQFN